MDRTTHTGLNQAGYFDQGFFLGSTAARLKLKGIDGARTSGGACGLAFFAEVSNNDLDFAVREFLF